MLFYFCDMGWKLINGDGMSACVVCRVGYAFEPDNSLINVLVSKENSFYPRCWFPPEVPKRHQRLVVSNNSDQRSTNKDVSALSQAKVYCCSFKLKLEVFFFCLFVVQEAAETAFRDLMEGP